MNVKKFMAAQLRMPSGWFGSLVVSRMMNSVNRAIIDSTVEFLNVAPHHHVLEIGFGGGSALARIAYMVTKGSVTGLDLSPDLVRKADKKFQREIAAGRVRLQLGNISHLPFPDATFDRVFTINTSISGRTRCKASAKSAESSRTAAARWPLSAPGKP